MLISILIIGIVLYMRKNEFHAVAFQKSLRPILAVSYAACKLNYQAVDF